MFQQLKLRKQAKIDYQQARGTAHKDLLQTVRRNLLQQQAVEQRKISAAEKEIKRLEAGREQKLRQALTDYLVKNRLTDVSGIGEARHADIMWQVYQGKLTDLSRAHQLPGIGERTQTAINQWIRYYQKNFARLLQEDFPGKQKVIFAYQKAITSEKEKIVTAEKASRAVQVKLYRIEPTLTQLEAITAKDFYRVLKDPAASSPELDQYIQGVFAEWEPMPDWFMTLIADAEVNWQPEEDKPRKTKVSKNKLGAKVERQPKKNKQGEMGVTPYQSDIAISWQPEEDVSEQAVVGKRPELRTLFNKNQTAIFSMIILVSFFCCWTVTLLPTEPERNALSTPARSATITAKPSTTAKASPSAEATMTPTPSRQATAAHTATVQATETAVPQAQVQVIINAANVRADADATAAVVAVVRANEILPVLDISEDGNWYLIELPDGGEGWIGSTVVEFVEESRESP